MTEVLERLRTLIVDDVMSRSAIAVNKTALLEEAASTMLKGPVSGVPVVDGAGRCVGMLTAFDFVRAFATQRETPGMFPASDEFPPAQAHGAAGTPTDWTALPNVTGHMTSAVQSVSRKDSLLEAAAKMCIEHVHRLPVLDPEGHVEGMLTSLDIVAAFVNAADEQRQTPKPSQARREKR